VCGARRKAAAAPLRCARGDRDRLTPFALTGTEGKNMEISSGVHGDFTDYIMKNRDFDGNFSNLTVTNMDFDGDFSIKTRDSMDN